MKYKHRIENNILHLSFEGDLIGENNGADLVEVVKDAIDKQVLLCALYISNVRYINSSGIGVLITILTKFRNKGGEVILVNPSEHVKKLLIITKLNAIFIIAETEEEAIKKLKQA